MIPSHGLVNLPLFNQKHMNIYINTKRRQGCMWNLFFFNTSGLVTNTGPLSSFQITICSS